MWNNKHTARIQANATVQSIPTEIVCKFRVSAHNADSTFTGGYHVKCNASFHKHVTTRFA